MFQGGYLIQKGLSSLNDFQESGVCLSLVCVYLLCNPLNAHSVFVVVVVLIFLKTGMF